MENFCGKFVIFYVKNSGYFVFVLIESLDIIIIYT